MCETTYSNLKANFICPCPSKDDVIFVTRLFAKKSLGKILRHCFYMLIMSCLRAMGIFLRVKLFLRSQKIISVGLAKTSVCRSKPWQNSGVSEKLLRDISSCKCGTNHGLCPVKVGECRQGIIASADAGHRRGIIARGESPRSTWSIARLVEGESMASSTNYFYS